MGAHHTKGRGSRDECDAFHRRIPHKDADALYAFKSRGFGGEIGVINTFSV